MNQKKQLYNRSAAGERIRNRREKMGLSRQKMAAQIGKAEKYYADIERGYCGMSLETMIGIAGTLGLTLDYIAFGKEEEHELPKETKSIMFYLDNCSEKRRKKAVELLQVYLSE